MWFTQASHNHHGHWIWKGRGISYVVEIICWNVLASVFSSSGFLMLCSFGESFIRSATEVKRWICNKQNVTGVVWLVEMGIIITLMTADLRNINHHVNKSKEWHSVLWKLFHIEIVIGGTKSFETVTRWREGLGVQDRLVWGLKWQWS